MRVDDATWAEIRRLYETTNESQLHLAVRFKVGHTTIQQRALKGKWGARPPLPHLIPLSIEPLPLPAALDPASVAPSPKKKRVARGQPDTPETRIARLFHLIDIQLDNLETLMTTGENFSAECELRIANSFKTVVGNLEKVNDANEKLSGATVENAQGAGTDDRHRKAEQLRRDIAQRLERLNAQWNAAEKPE